MPTLIESDAVNVTVCESNTNVSVGIAGIQGPAGTSSLSSTIGITGVSITGGLGFTGSFNLNAGTNVILTQQGSNTLSISATAGSSNLNGLISTGDCLLLLNALSGQFNLTGSNLLALINGLSGQLNISGANLINLINNISSNTGNFITNSNLIGLASTGYVQNTSGSINERINNLNLTYLTTGSSGAFYASSNPSNYITVSNLNGLISTGSANQTYLVTGASGYFYPYSNPNFFSKSGELEVTGTAAINYSNNTFGTLFNLSQTGTTLLNLINIEQNKNSITGIQVTGSNGITGFVNIVGIYGTNIILSGTNTIGISGGGGGGSTTNNTYNITGFGVTGISISGGNSLTGYLNIVQGNNIVLTQLGNTGFSIAGPASAGEANTASNLGAGLGVFNSKSSVDLRFNSISGGTGIQVTLSGTNTIFIDSTVNTGQFYASSNPNQFISTGAADLRYLTTGSSIGFLTTGYNVASINDLKNIQTTGLSNNTIVYVRSYYSDYADRGLGGGNFVWKSSSTSTEDSGRYLSSNTSPSLGRWERLLNGETPNVMMWGAKGDVTRNGYFIGAGNNDTPSIQKAFDASRNGWMATLRFPSASYKITGTLYWDAQQTRIVGDGCINNSTIYMDSGIRQDILVSYGARALLSHIANPATGTDPAVISITNDFPRIENIALVYAGNYNESFVTATEPLQNASNAGLTLTFPGETNGITNVYIDGGRYAIRILGPQGPGLRISNSTLAGQGDAAISVEAPIYPTWNGSAWVAATGAGVGMLTVDNCSSDYRGAYYTGYSFIKVQSGACPNIYIKDLKLEGEFSSGIVNYQRPNGYNSKLGSIDINGLTWNVTQTHGIEQNMVVIHPVDNTVTHSVSTSIKNCQFIGIDNVIKDYIAIGESGLPFVYIPDRDNGLSQQNFIPEINYQATRLNKLANDPNSYSSLALYKNDQIQIKFTPNRTGWWRIARGIGNASNLLNHEISISNYYEINKLKLVSDNKYPKSCEISSDSTIYNTAYIPITRARFFHNTLPWSGTSDFPLFLDIFVDKLPTGNGFDDSAKRIVIHSPQLGAGHNAEEEYTHIINPIFVSGNENLLYSSTIYPYCEVDLTRKQDRGTSFQTNYGNTSLINKDFHAFLDSNRNLRFFDAGVTISFNGGGGFAAGDAVIVNGELKHIILSDTGNNYTSSPNIIITPNTSGNGTGAFASGTFSLNGGLQRITILSGGAGYGLPPLGDNYGYTYLQTGTSGSFYRVSNPNNFISSGDSDNKYSTITNLNLTGSNSLNRDITLSGLIQSTGTSLQNQLNNITNGTGNFYLNSNPLNFSSSGNVENTGTSLQNQLNTLNIGTGNLYPSSNPNNFISSGNIVGASGIITYISGSRIGVAPYPFSKSVFIEYPEAGLNIPLFYVNRPINVSEVDALVSGDASSTVTYSLKYATGRQVNGTELNVGGILASNQNTGDRQFLFNNAYISGNTYLWTQILATGGNPKHLSLTMYLNYI